MAALLSARHQAHLCQQPYSRQLRQKISLTALRTAIPCHGVRSHAIDPTVLLLRRVLHLLVEEVSHFRCEPGEGGSSFGHLECYSDSIQRGYSRIESGSVVAGYSYSRCCRCYHRRWGRNLRRFLARRVCTPVSSSSRFISGGHDTTAATESIPACN